MPRRIEPDFDAKTSLLSSAIMIRLSPRPEFASLFKSVHNLLKVTVQIDGHPQITVLCHYAMRVWDRCHHGAWHLFGHSHGSLADDPHSLSWDVGIDANGFSPLSVPEIAAIMGRKSFRPTDHHGRRHSDEPE